MIGLSHYQTCAQAAIQAAGRTRGAAAANSRHHAQRLLSAFDALGPWKNDEPEPEPEEFDDPITQPIHSLQQRSDDERRDAIRAVIAARPGWIAGSIIRDDARLKNTIADRLLREMVEAGELVERQTSRCRFYKRSIAA